jgi:hypothetical protein
MPLMMPQSRSVSRRHRLCMLLPIVAMLLMSGSCSIASAQTIQKETALWYCHDGVLLLHAAHGNTSSSPPIEWDVEKLIKSTRDFSECYRRASAENSALELYAQRGYALASMDVAEVYNFMSLFVLIFSTHEPQATFTKAHDASLRYIRWAIQSLDNAQETLSNNAPDYSELDVYSSLTDAIQSDKSTATSIKDSILATTFDSVPRSKTELLALIKAGRVAIYTISSTWGLTKEELCPNEEHADYCTGFRCRWRCNIRRSDGVGRWDTESRAHR